MKADKYSSLPIKSAETKTLLKVWAAENSVPIYQAVEMAIKQLVEGPKPTIKQTAKAFMS